MTWPTRPVSELCLLALDCVNKTAPVLDGPTPYKMIRTTNVKGGLIDTKTVRYVSAETYQLWTRRARPKFGDVILTREAPVGEVGRCTFDESENIFLGQRLFKYRPDPELLDWNYLAYALQSLQVQSKLHGMSFGATVPHVKVGDAENLDIPYPPLATQRAIGAALAAYDDLIEANQRRISLLEEAVRVLYREWFVYLRFPGNESAARDEGLPNGWSQRSLGDLVTLNYGKALRDSDRRVGHVPVYGSSGIIGTHDRPLTEGPVLIVGRKGNVGSIFYSSSACFPIDTVYFVKGIEVTFFNYLTLKSLSFVSSDTAVPGLNRNHAYAMPVLVPSGDALHVFEQTVRPYFEQTENLTLQSKRLREARDALLPKLMSGEISI